MSGETPRKIPATMATQHPDHASTPRWKKEAFINTQEEVEECFLSFSELGCQEYMWDWEGKYVDEAVVDKLYQNHLDYFRGKKLGEDVFLTFRLPNIWVEKGFRLARAYMGILTYKDFAEDLGFNNPPVFEVILPMTDSAEKIIHMHKTFQQVARLKSEIFEEKDSYNEYIRVIPLIEDVDHLVDADKILEEYINLYTKHFNKKPDYIRSFIARSDPALNSGIVAATIAARIAISRFYECEEKCGIPVYPIIGVGSLPFRGHLTPHTIDDFLRQYKGIRTATLQSAFRYDYPEEDVKTAIEILNEELSSAKPVILDPQIVEDGKKIIKIFERHYRESVEEISSLINDFSVCIPKRRERMQHTGLFGYSRGVEGKRLPRAISYTASLYSIGVPPEIIGTGRGLMEVSEAGLLDSLLFLYPNIKTDLSVAGGYLNDENITRLSYKNPAWKKLKKDIVFIDSLLDLETGPKTLMNFVHRNLVSSILLLWNEGEDITSHLLEAAKIRKSLG